MVNHPVGDFIQSGVLLLAAVAIARGAVWGLRGKPYSPWAYRDDPSLFSRVTGGVLALVSVMMLLAAIAPWTAAAIR